MFKSLKPNHDIKTFDDIRREMAKKASRELIVFGIAVLFIVAAVINANWPK